ncbi:hypothetical protein TNCV_4716081 [Trichonephila clavipes]|nr:hypothetical protein TNCV_4716081 [Trichonephila clavipes]
MPKRSSLRDVGTSSYSYHTAPHSPASVLANRRTNDTLFVASIFQTPDVSTRTCLGVKKSLKNSKNSSSYKETLNVPQMPQTILAILQAIIEIKRFYHPLYSPKWKNLLNAPTK